MWVGGRVFFATYFFIQIKIIILKLFFNFTNKYKILYMKNINIISEAIYKGKHKLVNQGAFVNMTDIINDIFVCFNIPCCEETSDFFIRKAYLLKGRKKPGANWMSLSKLVMDIYNCELTENFCPGSRSEQWWITTDVIRPRKTIETISFTGVILKVFGCCNLLTHITTQNSDCLLAQNGNYIIK